MTVDNKSQITVKPPTAHIEQLLQKYGSIVEPIRLGMPYQWKQFLDN